MEAEETAKVLRVFNKKVSKLAIIGFIAFIIIGALFLMYIFKIGFAAKPALKLRTMTVSKGDINMTVTGSGPIVSSNTGDVIPYQNDVGKLMKVYFKEGDKIKAGDVMFEMDDSDARLNIEKLENQLAQMQLSQESNNQSLSKLNVTAPFAGQVSGIQVKVGDVLSKDAPVLTITDTSRLKLLVPFSLPNPNAIATGSDAVVYIPALMQSVSGTVSYVGNKSYSTAIGGQLYNVEITVNNPGSLKGDMKANAEVVTANGTLSSADGGTLAYINSRVVRSGAGGTVTMVDVVENQYVGGGATLVSLENDDLITARDTTSLKIQDLQAQIDTAKSDLANFKIRSPIDGTIVKQDTVHTGDTIKAGQVLATIADMDHLEFSIPVDELDIAKVKVGQKVKITVDAIPDTQNKPISGTVSYIAEVGTTSNGVTTYPVKVSIDNPDGRLKQNMNANAEIQIASKTNTLYVPVEAVQKTGNRAIVMVQGKHGDPRTLGMMQKNRTGQGGQGQRSAQGGNQNGQGQGGQSQRAVQGGQSQAGQGYNVGGNTTTTTSNTATYNVNFGNGSRNGGSRNNIQNSQYYEDAIPTPVEIGITNDSYVEITKGLNAGDVVILPPLAASTSAQTNAGGNRMMFGGGPGR